MRFLASLTIAASAGWPSARKPRRHGRVLGRSQRASCQAPHARITVALELKEPTIAERTPKLLGIRCGRYHRPMSETPPTEPTSAAEEITESAADPSPESDAAAPADEPLHGAKAKHSASAPRASKVPLWIAVAALVLALVSTGLAVAGYFYYPHKGEAGSGTFSDQQTKDAKKKICETFIVVDRAVVRNSHAKLPPETGRSAQFTVGIAARQAFLRWCRISARPGQPNTRNPIRPGEIGRRSGDKPSDPRHQLIWPAGRGSLRMN